ncbi:AAA family ATPase [Ruminococcus sp.]|uniref:AAA family ATPase n=1 Tax=Ruminococcus sp. TaxID=41978 RepID=UPI0025DC79C3|nr:AAA family ATPase [Ruminococcus sp.]
MATTVQESPPKYNLIPIVFETRGPFSEEIYEKREYYEREYKRALQNAKCLIVKGFSGTGKTWLTKHIISEISEKYDWINLSNVALYNSFNDFFMSKISQIKTEYSEEKSASANAIFAGGELGTQTTYHIAHNYFLEYLKIHKNNYIIFDNFEAIINNQKFIDDLGAIITLMDDPEVQELNIKFILIGTCINFKGFFDKLPNSDTIANRLHDLPEIKGFNMIECENHVIKAFNKIGIKIKNYAQFIEFIFKCTNGTPQNINDLCMQICYECQDNNQDFIDDTPTNKNLILINAQKKWIKGTLTSSYNRIFNLYRNNSGSKAINNNILYMISEIDKTIFTTDNLKAQISAYFPDLDNKISKTRIKKYLDELSNVNDNNNNILEKLNNNDYSVRDYKTIICINNILYLQEDEVQILDITEIE